MPLSVKAYICYGALLEEASPLQSLTGEHFQGLQITLPRSLDDTVIHNSILALLTLRTTL